MVDVMLMQARMKPCRTKPTSWIVGDIDQLPSVGRHHRLRARLPLRRIRHAARASDLSCFMTFPTLRQIGQNR
jgi:hypothetical protein